MELQGINRYPVLNHPDRDPKLRLAPIQFVRAQPQDVQPHYVALGSKNTTVPQLSDCRGYAPGYFPTPQIQRNPNLDFANINRPIGQPNYQNPGFYVVPQQYPAQMQANYSPEGYYIANPGYYVQHASHGASNEYFNEAAHQMTFAQQPADQATPSRLNELEAEVEKYKCVSYLFKGLLILTGLVVIGLAVAVIFGMMKVSPCAMLGRKDTRFCSDSMQFLDRQRNVLALLLVLSCLANVFYKFALKAYVERRSKAMNGIFYVFAFFFVMSIPTLNPISLLFYGYLARSTDKLRKIFVEMDAIKAQSELKLSETTTSF